MNQEKWFLDSTVVRASLVTIVPAIFLVLKIFGIDLGDEGRQQDIIEGLVALSSLAASAHLIYARVNAPALPPAPLTLSIPDGEGTDKR